jgi:hypothetical protein
MPLEIASTQVASDANANMPASSSRFTSSHTAMKQSVLSLKCS